MLDGFFAREHIVRHNGDSEEICCEVTAINRSIDFSCEDLDQFRSYLYLLARAHLGPRMKLNIDASDLVQQTLIDAHRKQNQFHRRRCLSSLARRSDQS